MGRRHRRAGVGVARQEQLGAEPLLPDAATMDGKKVVLPLPE